jgi:integrase
MTENAITTIETGIAQYAPAVNKYLGKSKAEATLRAYSNDWADFTVWCNTHNTEPLPASPEAVASYLADMSDSMNFKYSTIARRVASISKAHQAAGYESPTHSAFVRDTLKGIAREFGTAKHQASPLRIADIRKIIYTLPKTLQAKRDRALLLIGYVMAGRRSEVVALDVDDVTFTREGMRLTIRRSKTDQAGEGATFGVNFCSKDHSVCPVRALKAWIAAAAITSGPIFRGINRHGQVQASRMTDRAVDQIIRKYAPGCSGHSLRAGFVTDQYAAGTPEAVIAERSRHKSRVVMGSYRREANVFAFDYLSAVL